MEQNQLIPDEIIISKIHLIRGLRVMLDSDLAELYGVETKHLKRQVRRNIERFPPDFMFELTSPEFEILRSQFGTLRHGEHPKYFPFAFTEQGITMLSCVLNTRQAIEVNIQVVRIFTKVCELLHAHKDILLKLEQLEHNLLKHEGRMDGFANDIQLIFAYLKQLLTPPPLPPRKQLGFKRKDEQ